MKKKDLFVSGILILILVFFGCNVDGIEPEPPNTTFVYEDPDTLSTKQVAILDSIPSLHIEDPGSLLLPNGETIEDFLQRTDPDLGSDLLGRSGNPYKDKGPEDAKNTLITILMIHAWELTNDTEYNDAEPKQVGLGYILGGKFLTERVNPSSIDFGREKPRSICSQPIYGIDCSGYIYQIFKKSGIELTTGPAEKQRNPAYLESRINEAFTELSMLKVRDKKDIGKDSILPGDIIYWLDPRQKAFHIGIVLKDYKDPTGNTLAIWQSNGGKGTNQTDCVKNYGPNRGPNAKPLTDYWLSEAFSKSYGIVRIEAPLNGEWIVMAEGNQGCNDPGDNNYRYAVDSTGFMYFDDLVGYEINILSFEGHNTIKYIEHQTPDPTQPSYIEEMKFTYRMTDGNNAIINTDEFDPNGSFKDYNGTIEVVGGNLTMQIFNIADGCDLKFEAIRK